MSPSTGAVVADGASVHVKLSTVVEYTVHVVLFAIGAVTVRLPPRRGGIRPLNESNNVVSLRWVPPLTPSSPSCHTISPAPHTPHAPFVRETMVWGWWTPPRPDTPG